jgi:hypothetical protein
MIAGRETGNGFASSLTDRFSSSASRARSARRVGSESAAKVRSRVSPEYLTIRFSVGRSRGLVKRGHCATERRTMYEQAAGGARPSPSGAGR